MLLLDSRRLTGPNLLLDRPAAVMDVQLDEPHRDRAIDAWARAAREMLDAVGWTGEEIAVRTFAGGASLALSGPVDALYAATEVNEWAWEVAEAELAGTPRPDQAESAARLRSAIETERNPRLLALRKAARERSLTFLADAEQVSVGSGTGAMVWSTRDLPPADEVEWNRVHDIPVALVTGSNGKTTVVRLLAAMAAESGRCVGTTTTEGVFVGERAVAAGDYSGPEGARLLLRQPTVQVAVLETARGGLLRRGLVVERADVAVVTNVAADHLGEFGVQDLSALAQTKLLVARAVGAGGRVVLNAVDPVLAAAGAEVGAPVVWFSLEWQRGDVRAHLDGGGRAALLENGVLVLAAGASRTRLATPADLPLAWGGVARHNLANALAAAAAAGGLGVAPAQVAGTLKRFGHRAEDNPGRTTLVQLGGLSIVLDYAHNPQGMAALADTAATLPGRRRGVVLGQAGDRSDEALRELARSACRLRPDYVVLKEMDRYRRGRASGEVAGILAGELQALGLPRHAISRPGDEIASVRELLAWARPGDLLILTIHDDRAAVLALLDRLREARWQAGQELSPTA
jgi:UDP-N-acetylmuramyl tripeptide synthase